MAQAKTVPAEEYARIAEAQAAFSAVRVSGGRVLRLGSYKLQGSRWVLWSVGAPEVARLLELAKQAQERAAMRPQAMPAVHTCLLADYRDRGIRSERPPQRKTAPAPTQDVATLLLRRGQNFSANRTDWFEKVRMLERGSL